MKWITQKSDYEDTGLLIKPEGGQIVAVCEKLPDMEKNARLIASAPELLEACKSAQEVIAKDYPECCGLLSILEEAITKAEA